MPKFRKKPVVIEAVQWDGTERGSHDALAFAASDNVFLVTSDGPDRIEIQTLEGNMCADIGDWIIRGVKGEFYPCRDDIFRMTYEAVDAA